MKSKMKSAFAIIAVALMIMVAVVPMVSVFTGESDAADTAIVDPAIKKNIQVDVVVNDKVGTPAKTGTNMVKITYGVYSQELGNDTDTTGVTFYLEEASVPLATISFVDKYGVQIDRYAPITLTDLVAGNTYKATLQPGYLTQKVKFTFANNKAINGDVLGKGTFTGSYTVYSSSTATSGYSGVFTSDSSYDATILYPVAYASGISVYVKIDGFTAGGVSVSFPETVSSVSISNPTTAVAIAATDNLLTVSPVLNIVKESTVSVVAASTATPTTTYSIKPISNKVLYDSTNPVKAYYVTDAPNTGVTYTLTITAPDATVLTQTQTSLDASITSEKTLFGKVTVNDRFQAGSIAVTFAKKTETDSDLHYTLPVDDAGIFMKFLPDFDNKKNVEQFTATYTSGSFSFETAAAVSYGKSTASNVVLTTTEWKDVTVTFKTVNDSGNAVAKKQVKVSEAVFGSTVTDTNGTVTFLGKVGNTIGFSVDGATISGDVSITVNSSSNAVKLYMPVKTVAVYVNDASGNAMKGVTVKMIDAEKKADATKGVEITLVESTTVDGKYTTSIRADLTPETYYYVYLTKTDYKFDNDTTKKAVAYQTTPFASKSADYVLSMYKADGTVIASAANQITLNYATVYKNTTGSFVYNTGAAITPVYIKADGTVDATSGVAYRFPALAEVMKNSASSVTTTPIDVVVLQVVDASTTATSGIFEKIYLLTADEEGQIYVIAGVDSLTGTLTRLDEKTPIAGAKVTLTPNTDSASSTLETYTQEDGSFSFVSAVALTNAKSKVVFSGLTGYDFETDYKVVDTDGEKITAFKSKADLYVISFVDADEKAINVGTTQPAIKATTGGKDTDATAVGAGIANNIYKYKAAWTSDTNYIQIVDNATLKSSFPYHILTADELATGKITVTSYQSTYKFTTVDAYGKAIPSIGITLYTYEGDYPVATDIVITTAESTTATTTKGVVSIRLPVYDATHTDAFYTEYGYKVTTPGSYSFSSSVTAIESASIKVESTYGLITFYIVDAAGESLDSTATLSTTATDYEIYKNGSTTAINPTAPTATARSISFINDPDASYTVTLPKTTTVVYSFAKQQTPVDGVLFAKEEWVIGDVTDAVGNSIGIPAGTAGATVVKAYDIDDKKIGESTYAADGYYYKMLVDASEVAYFAVDKFGAYTFEVSLLPVVVANEQTVLFSASTANDVPLTATYDAIKAYDENEKSIGTATAGGIIVDVDEVAYYKANVASEGYNFGGISLTGLFVANESLISGSLPYSGKGTQAITLDLYLGDNLVASVPGTPNKYTYTAKLDMSGYLYDTAAVAFDSIVAVYSENGVIVAASPIDPFTQVNNIINPTIETFEIVLDAPSALVARHVSIARVGNTATVSADAKFIVSDDEAIYTDGQYIYTFAGWYVDNELVSHNAVFTFTATEDVVIAPAYTVAYEKISDANAQVDPEIIIEEITKENTGIDTNVLIIGICAVIVALIAVVYAVIKKE